jgi:hypothetical protein
MTPRRAVSVILASTIYLAYTELEPTRSPSRDLQALSLVQMLVGKAFPSAQNFDPDELSFRIEVEDDLARRSSASTRRSILGVDR